MRPSWKLAVIGGEVTVLAAFTGLGIHLAMQPHRLAFRPPPLVLPTGKPAAIPTVATPLVPTAPSSAGAPIKTPLLPDLFRRFALRAAGVPAPRTAYAEVTLTVPGKFDREYLGLYTVIEQVDKKH